MKDKYKLGTKENIEWLETLRRELLEFGKGFASPGGASYYLGDDGLPWKDRPKETWITSRMAHVYSIAEILYETDYGILADKAITGLLGELKDVVHGGWYAGIKSDGGILETKQCYAHAFVILAATSGILAGRKNAQKLLDDALTVYDKYFWNESEGLSCDTWDTEFENISDYRGLNANMHSVEAFLAVYDSIGDRKYLDRAGRIIDRVISWAQNNQWRIPEHFLSDWTPDLACNIDKPDDPFKPYGATPGHGIEWARLILQWAFADIKCDIVNGGVEKDNDERDISEIKKYIEAAKHLYERAREDAWNCDGSRGIVYTTDWNGKPVVRDRMHWTLAEAINTSAVLYRVTCDERYENDYAEYMRYLDEVVHDDKNGSWFHQLDSNNKVIGTVWPGKSDLYHAFQATLIPYNENVGVSIAKAVKNERGKEESYVR